MNKHPIILADGDDNHAEVMSDPTGRLDVGLSIEFLASGDEHRDRRAEVVIKVALLFLLFVIAGFVCLLIYLGLGGTF